MSYFVRFVVSEEYAENDLTRGYSFSDYVLCDTPEDVADHFGVEPEDVEILQHDDGRWGIALNGLCGFGPFETAEEAEEEGRRRGGYNGIDWPGFAIYRGSYVEDVRVWDGDCFRPQALVKFVEL